MVFQYISIKELSIDKSYEIFFLSLSPQTILTSTQKQSRLRANTLKGKNLHFLEHERRREIALNNFICPNRILDK